MNTEWMNTLAACWRAQTTAVLWQSSLLIALIMAIVALMPRWPSQLRYILLLVPIVKLALPAFPVRIPIPIVVAVPGASRPGPPSVASIRQGTAVTARMPAGPPAVKSVDWKTILLAIHTVGAGIGLALLLKRYRRVRAILRRGKPVQDAITLRVYLQISAKIKMRKRPALLSSSDVASPVAAGVFTPSILLPATVRFSPGELRTILAHEAAHIERGDLRIDFLQRIVQVIWWFNPLVWMLNRTIRSVREECCDALVVERDAMPPEEYCVSLIEAARKLAETRSSLPLLGISLGYARLANRIARVMSGPSRNAARLTLAQGISTLLVACLAVPNLKAARPTEPLTDAQSTAWIAGLGNSWRDFHDSGVVMNGANLDGVQWNGRLLKGAAFCGASFQLANLAGADLRGANLARANLRGADLTGADLSGANLTGADLTTANLTGARLSKAWLSGADLSDARATDANMDWAFLRGTTISSTTVISSKWKTVIALLNSADSGFDLRGADLSNANLSKANLRGADLEGANLEGTDLSYSDLRGTKLARAKLGKTSLEGSSLENADLRDASLDRANLNRSRLQGANLSSAQLRFATLVQASLGTANLNAANFNDADLRWSKLAGSMLNAETRLAPKWRLAKQLQENGAAGRNLTGVDLSELDLSHVAFRDAVLDEANLTEANFASSDFSGARLEGARLDGAYLNVLTDGKTRLAAKWRLVNSILQNGARNRDLTGADFSHANLSNVQMDGAILRNARFDKANLDGASLRSAILDGSTLEKARFHNTIMADGKVRSNGC